MSGSRQLMVVLVAGGIITALLLLSSTAFSGGPTTRAFLDGSLSLLGAATLLTILTLAIPIAAMAEPTGGQPSLSEAVGIVRIDLMNAIRDAVLADKGESLALGGPAMVVSALSEETRDEVEDLVHSTTVASNIIELLPKARTRLGRSLLAITITFPVVLAVSELSQGLEQDTTTGGLILFGTLYLGVFLLAGAFGNARYVRWFRRINALRGQSLSEIRRLIRKWGEEE